MDKRSHWTIESNIVNLSKITKNLSQVLENLEKEEVIDLYDLSLIVTVILHTFKFSSGRVKLIFKFPISEKVQN